MTIVIEGRQPKNLWIMSEMLTFKHGKEKSFKKIVCFHLAANMMHDFTTHLEIRSSCLFYNDGRPLLLSYIFGLLEKHFLLSDFISKLGIHFSYR